MDNLLTAEVGEKLWRDVQSAEYVPVHSLAGPLGPFRSAITHSNKVWRLGDGAPLKGPRLVQRMAGSAENGDRHILSGVLEIIAGIAAAHPECVGRSEEDWNCLNGQVVLYPSGSGLSWHSDGRRRSGAFIYFAHPYWNIQWGGELLIADLDRFAVSDAYRESGQPFPWIQNDLENTVVMEAGTGRYVMPKPNRLILIGTGVHHAVTPVKASAGDHVRATISGFFESHDE
jgi:Rps23 Pro-64 3,4-dihydroxylase Tpa1-like proline 4-hydroxylase